MVTKLYGTKQREATMKNTILVIGATGNQGEAVLQALLKTDFALRAFVRKHNPKQSPNPKIHKLKEQGIEIMEGDLDDFDSLTHAMNGCYGVFSVINFQDGGVAKEEERGKRVVDAAKKTGVEHFVYSSVGGADRTSGVPHFESKWHVEQYIRELALPYSIIRPTTFMTNLMEMPAVMRFIALSMSRGSFAEKPLQMIAVQDIGKWAAHMFSHRERYLSTAVEIAGDEVTFSQMVSAYKKVYNKTPGSMWLPPSLFSMGDIGKMFTWITTYGYKADLKMNRTEIPDLLTFEQFLALKKPS
jgi:uncharacterized protein YbjT (DUF2867 family)